MPKTRRQQRDPRDILRERWVLHEDMFAGESFVPTEGGLGFLCVDHYVKPPIAYVLMSVNETGFVAIKADLDDSCRSLPASELVDRIRRGDYRTCQLPVADAIALFDLEGTGRLPLAEVGIERFCDALDDEQMVARLRGGTTATMATKDAQRLEEAGIADLRRLLDTEAISCLAGIDGVSWANYEFYSAPGETGIIRRQAAASYPILAGLLASRPSLRRAIDSRKPLADTIMAAFGDDRETGKPRMPKTILSRLAKLKWPTNGLTVDDIACGLGKIDPNWFPKTRDDWDAFCDMTATVGGFLMTETGLPADILYKSCGGKWSEFRLRAGKAAIDMRPPEGFTEEGLAALKASIDWKALEATPREKMRAIAWAVAEQATVQEGIAVEDVADWLERMYAPPLSRELFANACRDVVTMLDIFARKVVLPFASSQCGLDEVFLSEWVLTQARNSAARILMADKSINTVFEMSRHMHSQIGNIMAAGSLLDPGDAEARAEEQRKRAVRLDAIGIPSTDIPDDGWPPLMPVCKAPNGVYIVPLTDPRLLEDEGRHGRNADGTSGQHHCVATYAPHCQKQGQHILSFRVIGGDKYDRLSTLRLHPVVQGAEFSVAEHRARHNGTVGEPSMRAWEWLQSEVREGRISLNFEGIRKHLGHVSANRTDDVGPYCGYDWHEERRLEEAFHSWSRYLGKRYRNMSSIDFGVSDEVLSLAEMINPGLQRIPAMSR